MAGDESSAGVLAGELHAAIESGSFDLVPPLAQAYGKAVVEAFHGARSSEDRTAIADQASSFLQDRLHLARVMRAHISTQVAGARRLASYGGSPLIENTWYVNG